MPNGGSHLRTESDVHEAEKRGYDRAISDLVDALASHRVQGQVVWYFQKTRTPKGIKNALRKWLAQAQKESER